MVTGWSDAREQGESRFSDGRRTQLSPLKVGGDGRHENTRGQMDEKILGGEEEIEGKWASQGLGLPRMGIETRERRVAKETECSVEKKKYGFGRGVIPGQLRDFVRRNLHQSEDSVRGRGRFR